MEFEKPKEKIKKEVEPDKSVILPSRRQKSIDKPPRPVMQDSTMS